MFLAPWLSAAASEIGRAQEQPPQASHAEQESRAVPPPPVVGPRRLEPARRWTRQSAGGLAFTSVQVNVDGEGNNIVGDAANEPSMAVNPLDADNIVIGWRQFDTVLSSFREGGWGYSRDHGLTWTFPGVLQDGFFRSDPVLAADANGNFYYLSLQSTLVTDLFKSTDGGASWMPPVPAAGGDKSWMTIDRTSGPGRGHIYQHWTGSAGCCFPDDFNRSTNGGISFGPTLTTPPPAMQWGTLAVGADGVLYMAGATTDLSEHAFARSSTARLAGLVPSFEYVTPLYLGGFSTTGGINGVGLIGQVWIEVDTSGGPFHGNLYVLGSVVAPGNNPADVMFIRSSDGGKTWSDPLRINDDPDSGAWHWFGAMSVAPNGRIDVTWYDTRNDPANLLSEVTYAFSRDGGETWSKGIPVSPPFDPHDGYPVQPKLGDYTQMSSSPSEVLLAYAATFNGEQDVYFLRIPQDCNENGVDDSQDIASGRSPDCNSNQVPDECEAGGQKDCNANGHLDLCDIHEGRSTDCDHNAIPDDCRTEADCDGNGLLDPCEIAGGAQGDCNHNGLPDNCDIAGGKFADVNGNGIPDICELNVPAEFDTIQSALDAALDGQVVLLAAGTYTGEGNRDLDFHGKAVTLRGDAGAQGCIIDAQGQARGIVLSTGEPRATRIEDLTITGGAGARGGGIAFASASSATVRRCVLVGNSAADRGGGLYVSAGSAPLIQDCILQGNQAGRGAGLFLDGAVAEVENCAFLGNEAATLGGGVMGAGDNTTLSQCVFSGNSAGGGGALFANHSSLQAVNCTLSGNSAVQLGGGLVFSNTSATLGNCILWGNRRNGTSDETAQIERLAGGSLEVTYSLIQGLSALAMTGNLDADPLFVDPAGPDRTPGTRDDNLRLRSGSPAADSARNAAVPAKLHTDIDGSPRFVDDPAAPDCPQPGADCGRPPIVDMGAYEVQDAVPIAIVASDPPDGAVDARQPFGIDGSGAAGWDAVELTFSGGAAGLGVGDFEVAVTSGQAPVVVKVTSAGRGASVQFDRPIPAGACTTLTHLPSGTSIVLGFLPADVNADSTSSPLDLLALVDGLNDSGSRPLEIWQCDIDRSGRCQPADILRAVDLLNGAGAYDPWNGAALPGCP
jgi:hypothetical protein